MLAAASRKNKVVLNDYSYRSDIENRLLLAQFSVFDVEVLNEILNSSLAFPIADLIETLETSQAEIEATLDKLAPTKLLQYDGKTIRVDKEKRKYYEFQIQKYEDDFAPDLDYIMRGLKRVPIQVLPNWYSIPRTTDDIFASIIEKYLHTPKLYQRHLQDLTFDDSIPLAIMRDVHEAEDFRVRAKTLREKYDLTREEFEEYMLLLEFNFACYLSYAKVDGMWKEVVTPMHEWREYLRFHRETEAKAVPEGHVTPFHTGGDFAFVEDMASLLRLLSQQPLKVEGLTLSPKVLTLWSPALSDKGSEAAAAYLKMLVDKLHQLHLIEVKEGHLCTTAQSNVWLRRSPQDQALLVYRLPASAEKAPCNYSGRLSEKNIRSVERSLRRVIRSGWVTFDDFFKGMCEPLGDAEPVILIQKGRRRGYVLPSYTEEDKNFVRESLQHRLFQAGIVSLGTYKGSFCFSVTPFGRLSFGE